MNNDSSADLPYCDLIMKGGITSGVVYPKMIAALAQKYRLKSIGGTSAGAIAAAAAAAAEYGRRNGQADSFARLGELPGDLGKHDLATGSSRLLQMFQPAANVAKHFKVLISALNAPHPLTAIGSAVVTIVGQFWGVALLVWLLGLLLIAPVMMMATSTHALVDVVPLALISSVLWWLWTLVGLRHLSAIEKTSPLWFVLGWWLVGLLFTAAVVMLFGAPISRRVILPAIAASIAAALCIALVLGSTVARFVGTLVRGIHRNFYGVCSGRTVHDAHGTRPLALTDWLTQYLNTLAGLPSEGPPLTFGHLWAGSDRIDVAMDERTAPAINLKVMTTAVSQQMSYSIPFRKSAPAFYYAPEEWEKLFPPNVMQWLSQAEARESDPHRDRARVKHVVDCNGRVLRRLPSNPSLPVVVAVRMSLSFPLLLSAVPLHAIDWSLKDNRTRTQSAREPRTYIATKVWFSDGGICSNLPLHFFDEMLPEHPTFGVSLKDPHPDFPIRSELPASQTGRVYLPTGNLGGLQRHWSAPDDTYPMGGLFGFMVGIVDTMQNWRDEIQLPYPGFRDRVAMISQLPQEGGLNLNMPKQRIDALSEAGEHAAIQLMNRFHAGDPTTSAGWRNHQSVRLRSFLGALEEVTLAMRSSLSNGAWQAVAMREVTARRYTTQHAASALDTLNRLRDCAAAMQASDVSLQDKAPSPRPKLRLTPRI